jgi:hypothetical protein
MACPPHLTDLTHRWAITMPCQIDKIASLKTLIRGFGLAFVQKQKPPFRSYRNIVAI